MGGALLNGIVYIVGGRTDPNGPTASHEDVRVRIYGDLSVATWAVPGTPSQRLMTPLMESPPDLLIEVPHS